VAALVLAAPATAATLYPPGGFRLPASNGYSLDAIAFDGDPHERPDALLLFFGRKGSSVLYGVQRNVEVTETSIQADLGRLGSVDLHFVSSGQPRQEGSSCDPQEIEVDSGFYEGRIEFEGEEGFTKVDAVRAPGEIRFAASLICSGSIDEGFGGHAPGALLSLRRQWPRGRLEFQAKTNSPTRPTRFSASIEEKHDGLGISRSISAVAGPGAFDFDVPGQTAQLRPPSPFQGTGTLHRTSRRIPGRLRGGLSVDFPGRSNVSLAGSKGSLVRYVDHPSHPFRPLP
jgi:hypothetical protein